MINRDLCCNESRTALNDVITFRDELVAFVEKGDYERSVIELDASTKSNLAIFMERGAHLLLRLNRLLNKSEETAGSHCNPHHTAMPAWELKVQRDWLSELVKQMDNMIAV